MAETKNTETVFRQNDKGILRVDKIYECNERKPLTFKKGTRFDVVSVGEVYLTVIYHSSTGLYLVEKWDAEKV